MSFRSAPYETVLVLGRPHARHTQEPYTGKNQRLAPLGEGAELYRMHTRPELYEDSMIENANDTFEDWLAMTQPDMVSMDCNFCRRTVIVEPYTGCGHRND